MSRLPLWLRCRLVLVAPVLARLGVTAHFIPLGDRFDLLMPRSSECASGYAACTNNDLPSNFCCTSGTSCVVLAANTTVVCCPDGETCDKIYPISCDITQQNATLHPQSGVKTTALTGTLEQCGNSTCCPFGYSCNGSDVCVKDADQSEAPVTSSSSTSTSSTSTSTSTSTSKTSTSTSTASSTAAAISTVAVVTSAGSTATATASASSTSSTTTASAAAATESSKSGPSTSTVVGGVVGGVAGLLVIGAALWFCLGFRQRRRSQAPDELHRATGHPKLNRSTSSFGNIIKNPLSISSPKLQNSTAFPGDFIRKVPGSPPPSQMTVSSFSTPRPVTPAHGYGFHEAGGRNESPSPGAQRATRRESATIRPIRSMRSSSSQSSPWRLQQPPAPLKHKPHMSEGEEINVAADPSIMAQSGLGLDPFQATHLQPPPALRNPGHQRRPSDDRLTTFTTMMAAANLNLDHYVPDSPHHSPDPNRR